MSHLCRKFTLSLSYFLSKNRSLYLTTKTDADFDFYFANRRSLSAFHFSPQTPLFSQTVTKTRIFNAFNHRKQKFFFKKFSFALIKLLNSIRNCPKCRNRQKFWKMPQLHKSRNATIIRNWLQRGCMVNFRHV